MPGHSNSGFTKAAQKKKFVRHRDLKLKESEIQKERKIQRGMCEGVCQRCREKVQWRFKYDKYKPLKAPATCQECRQKSVTKAYRTLCDPCAASRKVCASCCDVMRNENDGEESQLKTTGVVNEESNEMVEDDTSDPEGISNNEGKSCDEQTKSACSSSAAASLQSLPTNGWDERKFSAFASQKYSKSRIVGDDSDRPNI